MALFISGLPPQILHAQNESIQPDFGTDVEQTKQLIVMIIADINGSQEFGAGIIVSRSKDELLIATAYHLLHIGPSPAQKIQVKFRFKPETYFDATLLKYSNEESMDLALIAVKDISRQNIDVCQVQFDRLGDTSVLKSGDGVFPLGNPNGTPWAMPVAADKIADVLGSNITFQSSFITKGNSGGALLDTAAGITGLVIADQPPFGRAINIKHVIKQLNQWGYTVNLRARDFRGQTPLHLAADKGDINLLKTLLLETCSNINQRDDHLATPLHFAAYSSAEAVKFLIKAGADLNPLDADGDPPLEWADESRNVENIRFLVNAGAKWNRWPPLTYAAVKGDLNKVKDLVRDSNNIQQKDDHRATPLHFAAAYSTPEIVNLLIKSHANINAEDENDKSPIAWAAESGRIDIIKLLLEQKDAESQKHTKEKLVRVAIAKGQIEVVKFLVSSGIDLDYVNHHTGGYEYLLTTAIGNRQYKMMEYLIKSGQDPNAGYSLWETPLCAAIETGQIEAVKILREAGADINVPYSPEKGYVYPLGLVFDLDWNPDFKLQLLKALVSAPKGKSSVTIKKPEHTFGWSIGSIFLNKSDEDFLLEALKILMPAGADPNNSYYLKRSYYDDSGEWRTPLSLALDNGYTKAARYLREHGAIK